MVQQARHLAEELLFPAAGEVDRAERVPGRLLDALAGNGFYGIGAPAELSGLDLDDAGRAAVTEAFAGGCLAAAFVWMQHRGAVRAVAASGSDAAARLLPDLVAGRVRAGIAIGAATRTGPPVIRATADPDPAAPGGPGGPGGWRFDGTAPWVTGWGMIDTLLMTARDERDQLIWALIPTDAAGLRAEPLDLVAVRASGTVTLTVDVVRVPADRVLRTEPHAAYLARDAESLAGNGFLALGVAGRAISLLGSTALDRELRRARRRLLAATGDDAPQARAAAGELALRAAGALAVHQGSGSVLASSHAARLIREATFLLTFGTRPSIRAALLDRLGATRPR